MGRGAVRSTLVVCGLFLPAGEARAQRSVGPGGFVGIGFVAADAVGDLESLVDRGFGLQLSGAAPMAADGYLRVRADLGFVVYGYERVRFCDFTCRVGSALTTTNNIVFGGIGPELVLARGGFQPYLHATAGLSWFVTSSSLDDNDGYGRYLTQGDIVDGPDGSVTIYPNRSDADLLSFRFGVSVGIPN